jgi:hypothetical protein
MNYLSINENKIPYKPIKETVTFPFFEQNILSVSKKRLLLRGFLTEKKI